MGNLARKLHQEQHQEQQKQMVKAPKKVKVRSPWLSPGEKILGIIFTGMVCFGAVHIVSNQAAIYGVNKDIQDTKKMIQEQQKVNGDLEMQVGELGGARMHCSVSGCGDILASNEEEAIKLAKTYLQSVHRMDPERQASAGRRLFG